MEEDENVRNIIEDDVPGVSSSSVGKGDCRINCTDTQSLRSILDITVNQISELANFCNPDDRSQFISQFSDCFKNAVQENIGLNGLPFKFEQSRNLNLAEKKDHVQMVDDALCSKLSKTISDVAHKRKFCPDQCCRILNIQMKHEIQNLKTAKVVSSSESSILPISPPGRDSSCVQKERFSEYCREFNSIQETAQYQLKKKEELTMKISQASDIKQQQKSKKRCSYALK